MVGASTQPDLGSCKACLFAFNSRWALGQVLHGRLKMHGLFKVERRIFRWSIIPNTAEFEPLVVLGFSNAIDVLRITGEGDGMGFDIAVRLNAHRYAGGLTTRSLGPILILDGGFPTTVTSARPATMIRVRPRVARMSEGNVGLDASRLVQWCLSSHFRAVRVTAMGDIWRDEYSAKG